MKSKQLLILMSIFSFVLIPSVCFAADVMEEDVTPRSKKIYLEPQKTFFEKGSFKFLLGVTGGYDNNTHLDSSRDGDSFLQSFFRASFSSPIDNQTKGIFSYEFMNLLYSGEIELDLFRNGLSAGIEHAVNEKILVSSDFTFDSIEFINSGEDDYVQPGFDLKVTHKLPQNFFHSLEYKVTFRDYAQRAIRLSATSNSNKERRDWRNTFDYEFGKYFENDMLKLGFEYFYNASNEQYLDYYDYDSYRVKASHTHLFSDKLFSYIALSQQMRDYRERTLINDSGLKEWERTLVPSASIFYNINDDVTVGLNYTYRQNYSNEPLDRYSGALLSLSTYYRF